MRDRESALVAWYVDAWDSLGGRAFASYRIADDGTAAPVLDTPSVFIAPPFFRPEPIASRAPAFGATRGTFQAGLFLEGGEVAFETLDDIVALVQRGYGSGGMRPNPGGAAPPPPPPEPPEPESGEPERSRGGGRTSDQVLERAFASFEDVRSSVVAWAGKERPHRASTFQWSDHLADDLDWDPNAGSFILWASQALAAELLQRAPDPSRLHAVLQWSQAWNDFRILLDQMGLTWKMSDWLFPYLEQRRHRSGWLRNLDAVWDSSRSEDRAMRLAENLLWRRWPKATPINVYETLSRLPLPQRLQTVYRVSTAHDASVLTLLHAASGFGGFNMANDGLGRALLLFAAASIVSESEGPNYWPSEKIQQAFLVQLEQDALGWLVGQMPDRLFDSRLEAAIENIPRQWEALKTWIPEPEPLESEPPRGFFSAPGP